MITIEECARLCNKYQFLSEGIIINLLALISITIYLILYKNADYLIERTELKEEQMQSILSAFAFFTFLLLIGFFVYRLWFAG